MKALRLVIHQSSANYKKEETVDNKMTYPLPPVSTIIGAIHDACGYREYKPMDISIQGRYASMHREPYTDYCFLNSVQDDRGILVKMSNGDLLSNAFEKVASAQKPQGNSFRKGETISVHNKKFLEEYRQLKNLNDELDRFNKERLSPFYAIIKSRKKTLDDKKKQVEKNSEEYIRITEREKEIKSLEKSVKSRFKEFKNQEYTIPVSSYRTLTTSLKFYEVLDDIKLVLHIRAAEEVLNDIMDHVYDIKSIGRSEDFIEVEDAEIVELLEDFDDEVESSYSAYIDYDFVRSERIYPRIKGKEFGGTRYYLNKNYEIVNGKREFEKKKVLYLSDYTAEEFGDGLYLDEYKGEQFIVNFL